MEDPVEDIVRRFVMQSPPGELKSVLRNLHTLCGVDERRARFHACLPSICLEYTLRHQTPFTFSPEGEEGSAVAVLCCRANHLVSWVKATAKALKAHRSGATGDAIGAQFVNYFSNTMEDSFSTDETLPFLFVDYTHRCYVQIDPVEGVVVRHVPFADSSSAEEWVARLQEGGGETPSKLHRQLVKLMSGYVKDSYGTDESEAVGGVGPTTTASSHVARVEEANDEKQTYSLSLCCERIHPRSRWGCRWRSVFVAHVEGATVVCSGEVRIEGHLYESANVHVQLAHTIDPVSMTLQPGETTEKAIAQCIVDAVKKAEESVQQGIESQGRELGADSLKNLRRRLPLTKQLFDFRARARQVLK